MACYQLTFCEVRTRYATYRLRSKCAYGNKISAFWREINKIDFFCYYLKFVRSQNAEKAQRRRTFASQVSD